MKYDNLTVDEIRQASKAGWIALVPTGCTEQQGPHLPVGFDTWFSEEVCAAASEKATDEFGVYSLVLPALPFGPTPEHRGFGAGYIDLPQNLHESVLDAVLRSLTDQGFLRIILWQGCGQHQFEAMLEKFLGQVPADVSVFLPELPYHRVWQKIGDPSIPGGHADAFATSIALHLLPESVHRDRIRKPEYSVPDWGDPNLDLAKHTDTGVIGDPTIASAELGEQLWEAVVEEAASIIRDYDRQSAHVFASDERSP